ncbi:M20/M25/M40 family metallo-hydrolase [Rhodococcoides yunnanense]|uniref:M20/M25/M40 family metallo-hydrolase n=1 Tax=Rhodococcoides yunnanense TaxID=278209 RepID=UPI0009352C81
MDGRLRELCEWLAIPSVSSDPKRHHDVTAAAHWLARWLTRAGAIVSVLPTSSAPVVFGRFVGSTATVRSSLVYGHYDVQPAGAGWSSRPFTPVSTRTRLVARGSSDDKGQLFAHLVALRTLVERDDLHQDVAVLAEGAEEVGSPGLREVLSTVRRERRLHRLGHVVVSDTQQATLATPSITVSQRGVVGLDVVVDVGGRAVHAGRFGGAVLDPALVVIRKLDQLNLYVQQIRGLTGTCIDISTRLTAPTDRMLIVRSGGRMPARHSPNIGRHNWLTTHAAMTVTQVSSNGTAGSIATSARASVDIRLPPGYDAGIAARSFIRLLTRGCESIMTVRVGRTARGLDCRPDSSLSDTVDRVCKIVYGRKPTYARSGGTIRAVQDLEDVLGVPPLLWGFGPPDDNAHGPDEYLHIPNWLRSVQASTMLWQSIDRRPNSRRAKSDAPTIAGTMLGGGHGGPIAITG